MSTNNNNNNNNNNIINSLEKQIQIVTKSFQSLQNEYSISVESRQKLDAQKSENESVQKEFSTLLPTNNVYKLVGPVLLKQDQIEAKANVTNRLELISNEIKRVETQLADLDDKLEKKKMELVHLQGQMQQAQQTVSATSSSSADGNKAIAA